MLASNARQQDGSKWFKMVLSKFGDRVTESSALVVGHWSLGIGHWVSDRAAEKFGVGKSKPLQLRIKGLTGN